MTGLSLSKINDGNDQHRADPGYCEAGLLDLFKINDLRTGESYLNQIAFPPGYDDTAGFSMDPYFLSFNDPLKIQ